MMKTTLLQVVAYFLLITVPTVLCLVSPPPGTGSVPPLGVTTTGGEASGTAAPCGLETFFEKVWPILYAFDKGGKKSGVRDSSKNLRVLWTRALLSNLGKIDDPIAYMLLPRGTRKIVGSLAAKTIWKSPIGAPAVSKLDWIVQRTNFIDAQLQAFLDETFTKDDETNTSNNE